MMELENGCYGSEGDGYFGKGDGSGDGCFDGTGNGWGNDRSFFESGNKDIKKYDEHQVYYIDGINTIIYSVHGNYAEGAIVNRDLTLSPCFIAKEYSCFAHGETLQKAVEAVHKKAIQKMPVEERINGFLQNYPDENKKHSGREFFEWHYILTGSCKMGRKQFCKDNNIDIDAEYTPMEFLDICKDAYGGEIIKQIIEIYKRKKIKLYIEKDVVIAELKRLREIQSSPIVLCDDMLSFIDSLETKELGDKTSEHEHSEIPEHGHFETIYHQGAKPRWKVGDVLATYEFYSDREGEHIFGKIIEVIEGDYDWIYVFEDGDKIEEATLIQEEVYKIIK